MTALIVLALVLTGIPVLARLGGTGPVSGAERVYVLLASLPLLIALGAPAAVGVAGDFDPAHRPLLLTLTRLGVGLSVVLGVIGIGLTGRAAFRRAGWGWPLGGSVLLAGTPALMIALTEVLTFLARLSSRP